MAKRAGHCTLSFRSLVHRNSGVSMGRLAGLGGFKPHSLHEGAEWVNEVFTVPLPRQTHTHTSLVAVARLR